MTPKAKIYYDALLKSKRADYKSYSIDIRALKVELKELERARQSIFNQIEELKIKGEMSEAE